MTWTQGLIQDTLADGAARLQAIDPSRSFIVQAPAGSGKTALLTQRFLALLAGVNAPEQVVAMTFTKKAAAEMRERVLAALRLGAQPTCDSDKAYDHNTWLLARAVLQRDADQAWCLLQNPNRLRIRTIDSMNGYLVQQMPMLSGLGIAPGVTERAEALFLEAARETLKDEQVADAVAQLLTLVNGRYARAERLLVSMLQNRDQWMRLVFSGHQQADLEAALQCLVETELRQALSVLATRRLCFQPLPALAAHAASNHISGLDALAQANWPFDDGIADLAIWRTLANWVLTADGKSVRKSVDKRQGFPVDSAAQKTVKAEMLDCLAQIGAGLTEDELQALQALKTLPEPHYDASQWQALQALIALLKQALSHLMLVFKAHNETDFIAVAQAAHQALGEEDNPTDLALRLDYQLHHLLIDEFQDTSAAQFALLKKLIRGWQPDDGRTLFIVGDPMQSIYRFREAEVGNFLQAWSSEGLPIDLTPLRLTVNFRSTAVLVDWFNRSFKRLFPHRDNLVLGAVSYVSAEPSPHALADNATPTEVRMHWALNRSAEQEAVQVGALIAQSLANTSAEQTLAVLGRSRRHLAAIALQLKQQGMAFRAVELEHLHERQEIQDMLALSRALLHQADRAAWLALLRCPFIGLSLADLYRLCGEQPYALMPALIADNLHSAALSSEGQARLNQAWLVIEPALNALNTQPFSRVVHQAWLALGGAYALSSLTELDNVQIYIEGLAQWDGQALTAAQLDEWVTRLYAGGDASEQAGRVQLMTMHKSKGLQFDTVILPALGKSPRADDKALLSWLTFASEQGEALVFAPLDQHGQDKSALNQLIARVEQQKQAYEDARLFYVAATRAERVLHLFGSVNYRVAQAEKERELVPGAGSLLSRIWPLVKQDFAHLCDEELERLAQAEKADTATTAVKVSRLPLQRPPLNALVNEKAKSVLGAISVLPEQDLADEETSDFGSLRAQKVGDLVHDMLQKIVETGFETWTPIRLETMQATFAYWLKQQGVMAHEIDQAVAEVLRSLIQAISYTELAWTLDNRLRESATELALTENANGQVALSVVDRTFVDEHGVRWIIDYKTAWCEGDEAAIKVFIQQQVEVYQSQLARYGRLMAEMDQREQCRVLWFTALNRWVKV